MTLGNPKYNMNTKQYLKQAYLLNELIDSDLKELENLRDLSTSITSDTSKERVQSSSPSDKIGNIVVKIITLENQINDEIDKFIDLKSEIRSTISAVVNPNEKLVLRLRYIEFLTWEQVAERMTYSVKQVFRIHGEAIKNLTSPES